MHQSMAVKCALRKPHDFDWRQGHTAYKRAKNVDDTILGWETRLFVVVEDTVTELPPNGCYFVNPNFVMISLRKRFRGNTI